MIPASPQPLNRKTKKAITPSGRITNRKSPSPIWNRSSPACTLSSVALQALPIAQSDFEFFAEFLEVKVVLFLIHFRDIELLPLKRGQVVDAGNGDQGPVWSTLLD